MKKLFLVSVLAIALLSVFAQQPWMNNLPQDKVSNGTVTFFEMQKAFYEYWEPFKVNKGKYVNSQGVEVKAPGWKQFKRWEWYWETRVNAQTGEFPTTSAWEEMQKFQADNPRSVKSVSGDWTSVGPTASPGGYAGLGRLNCVGFHPTDNNTIYAGSASGGLWKTTNGGTSWIVLNDNLAVLGVSDICVNTSDPNTIYIATGDKDGGSVWSLGGGQYNDNNSIGVMKSTDGGATWNTTGLSFSVSSKRSVFRLLMDPVDSTILYAATSVGFFKTTNAGANWTKLYSSTIFCDLEFNPSTSATIYASNKSGDIYRSVDAGVTWTNSLSTSYGRVEMAVSQSNINYVYAVMEDNSYPSDESPVYKSTDGGASFTRIFSSTTKSLLGYDCDGSDVINSQAGYDLTISVDPTNANNVFVGGINVWKSTDGGSTWNINTHWSSTCSGTATTVHADQHYLAYQPVTNHLFLGNDGGLYKTTNTGASWLFIGNGIVNSQLYRIGVSQTVASEVIAGLQDNGTKLFSGGIWDDVKGGDGMECIIDYTNANIQYGTYVEGQIDRTSNHWASSTEIQPLSAGSGYWVTPYIIDPTNSQTLYAGYADVWKTTNRGENHEWTKISTMATTSKIRSMAIAPSNTQVLYVADPSNIWKTSDGGTNWSNITAGLPVSTNDITYISVKADDPLTVWVTFGEYNASKVYQTVNGGTSWTNISTGLPSIPVMCVIQNKQVTSRVDLYAATDVGVFVKEGNADWQVFSTGLPNVLITELEIYYDANPGNNKLYAATYGRGLWVSDLYESGVLNPTNVTATASSTSQIDLSWVLTLGNNVLLAYNTSSTFGTPANGSTYSNGTSIPGGGTVLYNGSNTAFNHTSLNPNTTYYYKIWSSDGSNNYSSGITKNATTHCGSFTLPFTQSFDATSIPDCWSQVDMQGNGQVWEFGSITDQNPNPNLTGNYAYLNSDAYGSGNSQNADLVSPTFDFTAFTNVTLQFKYYYISYSGSSGTLSYSINNGANWTVLQTFTTTSVSNPITFNQVISALDQQSQVKFKWNFTGTWGYYWAIDDINITGTTHTWTGIASTDWNTASNWSPTTVPVTSTKVLIPTGLVNYPVISTSGSQCANLQISSGGSVTITPTGTLTVSGVLTNNAGNAGLVVQSTALGTGSLISSTSGVSATVERYIAAWTNASHGWHFLSSPVASQAISPTFVDITANPISSEVDLYRWSEPENLWINIKNSSGTYNVGSASTNWSNNANPVFETGAGYMAANGTNQTKIFTGTLNTASVALTGLTKTNQGWHLVGNPFSSAIKWSQVDWVKTNIASFPQIWNEATASYKVLAGEGIIPAQNGFLVYVTEATGSLTIPANARLHSDSAWYKNSTSTNEIVLVAHDPEGKTAQESIIGFNADATEDFDLEHDSYFMAGFAPMFYSISQNKLFALNTLPELTGELVVPLGFVKNQSSNFTIGLTQNISGLTLYLVDLKTNKEHKISESAYSFTSKNGDNANRFLLKFSTTGIDETPTTPQINAWVYNNTLYVNNCDGNTQIDIFDLAGRSLLRTQLTDLGLQSLPLVQPTGLYLIRLTSNGKAQTIKAKVKIE